MDYILPKTPTGKDIKLETAGLSKDYEPNLEELVKGLDESMKQFVGESKEKENRMADVLIIHREARKPNFF